MSRYIDADALKPDYIVGSTSTNTECYRYVSLKQIMNTPTADVAEVVRCKECVFFENENPCGIVDWWNSPDDFCSKGRRRE